MRYNTLGQIAKDFRGAATASCGIGKRAWAELKDTGN